MRLERRMGAVLLACVFVVGAGAAGEVAIRGGVGWGGGLFGGEVRGVGAVQVEGGVPARFGGDSGRAAGGGGGCQGDPREDHAEGGFGRGGQVCVQGVAARALCGFGRDACTGCRAGRQAEGVRDQGRAMQRDRSAGPL